MSDQIPMHNLHRVPSLTARVNDRYKDNHPDCFCCLEFENGDRPITHESIWQARGSRQPPGAHVSEVLHDLLSSSLVPLTETATDPMQFGVQATEFLSCFANSDVIWDVNVDAVPFGQARAIYGMTENARVRTVSYRFLRFRFPFVQFEWHVQTPYHKVNALLANNQIGTGQAQGIKVKFFWKAWTKNYAASAVIAVGSCTDTLILCPEPTTNSAQYPAQQNRLVISAREFVVAKVIQPELMKPIPYPRSLPPHRQPQDFNKLATSQTVMQLLKGSQKRMAFLIALSALATSVKPLVDKASTVAGLVLAGVAVFAAAVSVLVFVIGLALKWIEGNSARYHN